MSGSVISAAATVLLGGAAFSKLRGSSIAQDEPAGIPSTREASYTPRTDPTDRPT